MISSAGSGPDLYPARGVSFGRRKGVSFARQLTQYEASAAYISSQRHEGWKPVSERFDDGGLSGGTLERPALQRLMAEIDAGRIGMIVVYKIDRLTRSLADFVRLLERLDAKGASFVSVTQAFNTATSMGRLTLNVLLSFAQFEREVSAESIRDKIAASKKKGLWVGGTLPLGYDRHPDPQRRELVVNPAGAEIVRALFRLYAEHANLRLVETEAHRLGASLEGTLDKITAASKWWQLHPQPIALPPDQPGLHRPHPAQGSLLPRAASGDHRSSALGGCPGKADRRQRPAARAIRDDPRTAASDRQTAR